MEAETVGRRVEVGVVEAVEVDGEGSEISGD